MSGGVDYFTHKDGVGEPDLFEDKVPVERIGYITDLLTERAIKYLSRRHSRPFYLSLHYTAPHWPWEGPEDRHIGDKPEGVASEINRLMRASTGSSKYATFFYGLYDDTQRTLTYVNAGHNAPISI